MHLKATSPSTLYSYVTNGQTDRDRQTDRQTISLLQSQAVKLYNWVVKMATTTAAKSNVGYAGCPYRRNRNNPTDRQTDRQALRLLFHPFRKIQTLLVRLPVLDLFRVKVLEPGYSPYLLRRSLCLNMVTFVLHRD